MSDATIHTHEGSLDSWLRLAAELERIQVRPTEHQLKALAADLGLDARTVRSAVKLRFGQDHKADRIGEFFAKMVTWPIRLIQPLFDKHPYVTSGIVAAIYCLTAVMVVIPLSMLSSSQTSEKIALITLGGVVLVALAYFVYQGALLYNNASVKLATRLAFFVSALPMSFIAPVLIITFFYFPGDTKHRQAWEALAIIPMLYVSFAIFFAVIFVFAAAAGGYAKAVRRMSEERDADRQTLLKRVFDLRSRLDSEDDEAVAAEEDVATPLYAANPLFLLAAKRPLASAFVGVVLLQLFDTVGRIAWYAWLRNLAGNVTTLIDFFSLMLIVVGIVVMFQVGAATGSLRRAWPAFATIALGVVLSTLFVVMLPRWLTASDAPHTLQEVFGDRVPHMLVASLLYYLPLLAGAMTGAYGSFVQRERSLASNDRRAITAEIERLRSKLEREMQQAHFLSVDVVGSTAMKADEDPLAVEYTFTEFHRFVAQKVLDAGGVVRSTAGDGALAAFRGASSAIDAGLAIQRDIASFNKRHNNLAKEFSLRIGIHGDTVSGDAPSVNYSNAIDIAAHVERVCPAGKVAVTVPALESLGKPMSHERLDQTVDGLAVAVICPSEVPS